LWTIAGHGVVARLGAFSRTLAPGLRLGWLTAGRELIERMVEGGLLDSGGGINHYSAVVVAALCASGDYDANLLELRRAYGERRDALVAVLAEHLPPSCTVHKPGGGFFVWASFRAAPRAVRCSRKLRRPGSPSFPAHHSTWTGPADRRRAWRSAYSRQRS
jgi:DNA-binding transcriptional MocR family regulator